MFLLPSALLGLCLLAGGSGCHGSTAPAAPGSPTPGGVEPGGGGDPGFEPPDAQVLPDGRIIDASPSDARLPPDGPVQLPPGLTVYGAAQGMPALWGADIDEAGNVWAAGTDSAVYLKTASAAAFRRLTKADGLHDTLGRGLFAIAGGAGGEAFVGYVGCDEMDPINETPECRAGGDMDRVHLLPTGALDVYHYELHNTYAMQYDETRSVWRILYAHDGPARGVVFVGGNHGVTRIDGLGYRDHIHASCAQSDGILVQGNWRGLTLDPQGNLWTAGAYMVGLWTWVPVAAQWLDGDGNQWKNGLAFRVIYDQQPCDMNKREDHFGVALTADGRVWFAARGHGLAMWDPAQPPARFLFTQAAGLPDLNLTDVVLDGDGKLWLGTEGAGMVKFDPQTGRVVGSLTTGNGLPSNTIRELVRATWAGQPVMVIATAGGLALLRE